MARKHKPTDEQQEIIDKVAAGWSFVIQAGAGTGKTATLAMAAETITGGELYLAYNKEIVDGSKGKFPDNVGCRTAHSLAMAAVGHQYRSALNCGAVRGWQLAKAIGIRRWASGDAKLSGPATATLARETINRWAGTVDPEISEHHVPVPETLKEHAPELRKLISGHARRLWGLCLRPGQTSFRFNHDWYLKLWSMSGPDGGPPLIPVDTILFDECQDADPVIRHIFEGQPGQKIACGDGAQALYAWRGAENAIEYFREQGAPILPLSRSWRFGQAVADEANRWLTLLGSEMVLSGNPAIESSIGTFDRDQPHAVLCRTNSGVMEAVMAAQGAGRKVAMAGGGEAVKSLARACERLQAGKGTEHLELAGFDSWSEVIEYTKTKECDNPTLRTLVKLSAEYTMPVIVRALDTCVEQPDADITASTVHRAKGLEWPRVRLGADFAAAGTSPKLAAAKPDLRVAYVAVTRARDRLDTTNLMIPPLPGVEST